MAIKKANRILGLIKKSFVNLDTNSLPLLYKSLVMPHLEYGNIIWGPHYKEDQKAIEKVQKRATKLIPSIQDVPYEERLRQLNLPLLMHRYHTENDYANLTYHHLCIGKEEEI